MNIRPANEEDYPEVIQLLNEFVGMDRYSDGEMDSFKKALVNEECVILVVEVGKQLAALATFSIRYVIRYPRPIIEIDELYVRPDFRRQGYARALLKTVKEKGEELGCYRVVVKSHMDQVEGHLFYESIGFTNYGHHFIQDL